MKEFKFDYYWVDVLLSEKTTKPILLLHYLYNDLEFDTTISVNSFEGIEDWISISCYAFDLIEADNDKKLNQLLRIALETNFILPETTFGLFDDRYLYILGDLPLNATKSDFEFEINGINAGLNMLFDKLSSLGYKLDPTKGKLPIKKA
ncbi:MAG: hypothetical protein ACTSPQ_04965 [Candidatus Helarchaeota archaeon]